MEMIKQIKPKKEKIAYFTDEMHKEIYAFQEGYKQTKSAKPTAKTYSFITTKK
jgi:vacuolar-type H+-ATPase catalytic subunit A/Vma1